MPIGALPVTEISTGIVGLQAVETYLSTDAVDPCDNRVTLCRHICLQGPQTQLFTTAVAKDVYKPCKHI